MSTTAMAPVIPRQYQNDTAEAVIRLASQGKNPIAIAATGLGKTTIIGICCQMFRGRILVLTHRRVIKQQLVERLQEMLPWGSVGVEHERKRAGSARVVVAPVITMAARLQRFHRDAFDLIIVDECHRANSETFDEVFEHFADVPRCGFTATPDQVGPAFDTVAASYSVPWAIANGWLVGIRARHIYRHNPSADEIALATAALPGSSIVFGESLQACSLIVRELVAIGVSAEMISGSTPKTKRQDAINRFRAGRLSVLVNFGVITEGFDAQAAVNVVIARKTWQRDLMAQIVGRGLRPTVRLTDAMGADGRRHAILSSNKPYCRVVDFGRNLTRNSLEYGPVLFDAGERAKRSAVAHGQRAATAHRFKNQSDFSSVDPNSDSLSRYRADVAYKAFFETAERCGLSDQMIRKYLGI